MRFSLKDEEICKEKWQPWFNAGAWKVQYFTSPKSAEFQIPKGLPEKLDNLMRSWAACLNFPHDGEAVRGQFMFCFDFKYHGNTSHGIWIMKADYDKYWSWRKPWFYVLVWADDRQKRYIHQIRNPVKAHYKIKSLHTCEGSIDYYDIPDAHWIEAEKLPDMPIKIPANLSTVDSFALQLAINSWVENDFKGEFAVKDEDKYEAKKILASTHPRMVVKLRKACYHWLMRKA